jgi:hypothetical protein
MICKLNYKAMVVNAQSSHTVILHLVQSGDFSITQLPIFVTSVSHHVTVNLDAGVVVQTHTLPLLFILILSTLLAVNAIESVVLLYFIIPILLFQLSPKEITQSLAVHVARANCTLLLLSIIAPLYVFIAVNTDVSHTTCNLLNGLLVHIPTLPLFNTVINNVPPELDHQSILAFVSFVIAKYQVLSNIKADHEPPVSSQADLPKEFHNDILGVFALHQLLNLNVLFDETICKEAVGLLIQIPKFQPFVSVILSVAPTVYQR